MGFDLLSRTKTESLEPEWQTQLRTETAGQAMPKAEERVRRAGESYDGELTAPLSDQQNRGLGVLGDALDRGPVTSGESWGQIQAALQDQLAPGDDPAGKSYYQNYKTALIKEMRAAEERMASSRPGGFVGDGRMGADAQSEVAAVLGQLSENDRSRRNEAIPLGLQATELEDRLPFDLINASQTTGSLPRAIEQQQNDADYQEWMRSLNDLGIPLDTIAGLTTYTPNQAVFQDEGYLGEVAGAIGAIIGGIFGGGQGAAQGYKWGSASGKASDGSAQSVQTSGGK